MNLPKVLICILCGPERHHWVNPQLVATLLRTLKDKRFETDIEFIFGSHGIDVARNLSVEKARQKQVDWCIQFDNDMMCNDPLGILAEAEAARLDIVALSAGIIGTGGAIEPNVAFAGERCGNFMRVSAAGAGVLMIHSRVWAALPKLFEGNHEDVHFCQIAQAAGFKVWTHASLAGHLHSVDLTAYLRGIGTGAT